MIQLNCLFCLMIFLTDILACIKIIYYYHWKKRNNQSVDSEMANLYYGLNRH